MSVHPSGRPSLGVLHFAESEKQFRLTRHAPSDALSPFIRHYWIIRWDLTDRGPYLQDVIPNPCVNLVIERGRSGIFGPAKGMFSHLLEGQGCVFGVKFQPGGFYPFVKKPVSGLSGRPMDVGQLLGAGPRRLEEDFLSLEVDRDMVELADRLLLPLVPEEDPNVRLVQTVIDGIMRDRELTRVDAVCEAFGINKRKLQRLFDQYVGVTPKWVIRLYRLQNAAEAMEQTRGSNLLQLSMDLGYHDQAHFIKDFKAIVGRTPEQYAR